MLEGVQSGQIPTFGSSCLIKDETPRNKMQREVLLGLQLAAIIDPLTNYLQQNKNFGKLEN